MNQPLPRGNRLSVATSTNLTTGDSIASRLKQWLMNCLLADVDALSMRVFEVVFTTTFLVWMSRCFLFWREWLTAEGFHLNATELASMVYPDPWPTLSAAQVAGFAMAIFGSGIMLILNVWRRASLIILFFCALYAQRVDFMAGFTLSKMYVCTFAILAAAPAMRRDHETGRLTQCVAPMRMLQMMLILQYFASGLAKASGDWLDSRDILWGHAQGVYRTEFAAFCLRHIPKWGWTIQQYAALSLELFAPLLFTIKRLRPVAFVVGIGFHVLIALMMGQLIFFQSLMCSFYLLFVPSEKWRTLGSWLRKFLP
jgi:hypothetical protein